MKLREVLALLYVKIVDICGLLRRFRIIRYFRNIIITLIRSDFAIVHGHKMVLDPKDALNLSIHGVYEKFTSQMIRKMIKKGDVVLDIGANIGIYSL